MATASSYLGGEIVATENTKTYTVTLLPSKNAYGEAQLMRSIIQSLYAVTNIEIPGETNQSSETEQSMKGENAIA